MKKFMVFTELYNLRRLNQDFCDLARNVFSEPFLGFRSLREAQLGNNCIIYPSEILEQILTTCPVITKLSAEIGNKSDAYLFSLCKYCSQEKGFIFCPENGACSQAAKHLRHLRVKTCGSTGYGIACALQHLPLLEDFAELPAKTGSSNLLPDVTKGITALQEAAAANLSSPIILNLRDIFFNKSSNLEELRTISLCCPKLHSVQLDLSLIDSQVFTISSFQTIKGVHLYRPTNAILNSEAFRQFLAVRGDKLESLSFISCQVQLDLVNVNNILKMCNSLQQLTFWEIHASVENSSAIQRLPSCIENVEEIIFVVRKYFPRSCNQYFRELLGRAKSVKFLNVCWPDAEEELAHVVETNDFGSLEELLIQFADPRQIPLERLVTSENNLKKLHFRHNRNLNSCIKLYRDIARNSNYEIEIGQVS